MKQPVAQHKNLPVTQAGFVRAADDNELHPDGFSRFRLLGEPARAPSVFGYQISDRVLAEDCLVQLPGERALHGNNVPVRDSCPFTGGKAFMGRQDAGKNPLRRNSGKGRQFLRPGGQKDVSLLRCEQR